MIILLFVFCDAFDSFVIALLKVCFPHNTLHRWCFTHKCRHEDLHIVWTTLYTLWKLHSVAVDISNAKSYVHMIILDEGAWPNISSFRCISKFIIAVVYYEMMIRLPCSFQQYGKEGSFFFHCDFLVSKKKL